VKRYAEGSWNPAPLDGVNAERTPVVRDVTPNSIEFITKDDRVPTGAPIIPLLTA
jgi:hypothetical protein